MTTDIEFAAKACGANWKGDEMITDERITELWNLASNTATSKPDWTYSEIIFATVRAVIAEHDAELRKQEPYAFVTGGTIKDECNSDCFYECDHHCPPCPLAAPIPPTIPDGWQLVPKVGTQGCMPCSDGDKPPHDAEPVKDDEWVQCYLYTLLDEAKRRGGMFPQTSEEQDDDSKAIFCVADMVRFYGQQGYPKQDAIAKLQALRASNFSQQGRRNDG